MADLQESLPSYVLVYAMGFTAYGNVCRISLSTHMKKMALT